MDFKIERPKVHTQKGAIIGQFRVDGEQVKGEVDKSFAELATAAEREASDRINRDRIPRHYHKAIKEYFSNMRRSVQPAGPEPTGTPSDAPAEGVPDENGPASDSEED